MQIKTNVILVLCFLLTLPVTLFAQITQEMYDNVVEERAELRKQKSALEILISQARSQRVKDSIEIAKLAKIIEDQKPMVKENNDLKKAKSELEQEINKLQSKVKSLESQIKSKDEDLVKLRQINAEKIVLEREKINLDKEIASLKSDLQKKEQTIAALAPVEAEKTKLEKEKSNLEKEVESLQVKVATLTAEKALAEKAKKEAEENYTKLASEKAKLEAAKAGLEKEVADLQKQIESLKNAKTLAEQDKKQAEQQYAQIRSIFNKSLAFAVENLVKSSDYNGNGTDKLLVLCQESSPYLNATELQSMTSKLKTYKNICAAFDSAKIVLNQPYDKAKVDAALATLRRLNPTEKNQKEDIQAYQILLEGYCKRTEFCRIRDQSAQAWIPDFPDRARQEARNTLLELDLRYSYLRNEIQKRITNPSAKGNFPANAVCN